MRRPEKGSEATYPQPHRGDMDSDEQLTDARQSRDRVRRGTVENGDHSANRQHGPGTRGPQQAPNEKRPAQAQARDPTEARGEHGQRRVAVERQARELAQQGQWLRRDQQDHAGADQAIGLQRLPHPRLVSHDAEDERESREMHPPGNRLQCKPDRRRRTGLRNIEQKSVWIAARSLDDEPKRAARGMRIGSQHLPAHDVRSSPARNDRRRQDGSAREDGPGHLAAGRIENSDAGADRRDRFGEDKRDRRRCGIEHGVRGRVRLHQLRMGGRDLGDQRNGNRNREDRKPASQPQE